MDALFHLLLTYAGFLQDALPLWKRWGHLGKAEQIPPQVLMPRMFVFPLASQERGGAGQSRRVHGPAAGTSILALLRHSPRQRDQECSGQAEVHCADDPHSHHPGQFQHLRQGRKASFLIRHPGLACV